MRVLTIVPSIQAHAITETLHAIAEVRHCAFIEDCARTLGEYKPHALVIDPELLYRSELTYAVTAAVEAGVHVVLYFRLLPEVVPDVVRFAASRRAEFVLSDAEDSHGQLLHSIQRLPQLSLQSELFSAVADMLQGLPPSIATGLTAILIDRAWASPKNFPGLVGISRRTMDRSLHRRNYATLRTWSLISRLSWAYTWVQDATIVTDAGAARAGGYEDVRSFRRVLQAALGVGRAADLRAITPHQFVVTASMRLRQSGS